MRGKIFTRAEADRMVPLLRRIVVNIRARQRLLRRKQDEVGKLPPRSDHDARSETAREALLRSVRRLREEIHGHEAELEALGCFLRDADAGVVECYGELGNDIVYFAWTPGDAGFLSWHALDQSFVNRQPMPGIESGAAL